MQVLYQPQRSELKIAYEFQNDVIVAHFNGQKDTFDFSVFADGQLDNIETDLPIKPIISAKRVEGELYIELLYFHSANASYEEKFPQWKDHTELEVGVYNG